MIFLPHISPVFFGSHKKVGEKSSICKKSKWIFRYFIRFYQKDFYPLTLNATKHSLAVAIRYSPAGYTKTIRGRSGSIRCCILYKSLQNTTEYPPKFNSNMSDVLEKLSIQMTALAQWAKENKD
jgi:hypothetical protein